MTAPSQKIEASLAGQLTIGGDIRINRFGFGAMRITGKGIWGPPPDPAGAIALLKHVVDRGVNFIDTADSYGPAVSEELIAEALHPYPAGLIIATKAGLTRTGPNAWPIDAHPDRLKKCCEDSLRRLRLDTIDLYQLHRFDPHVPVEESLGAFVELQKAGKIRHIGISQVTVEQLERAQKTAVIASVQNMYNIFERTSDGVVSACEKQGIAFLPWFPLGGGENVSHAALEKIAGNRKATPHQIAIAWLLQRSPMMLPIAGTSSIAHFDDNLGAVEITLTPQELKALED